jgi:hypothetical protein
MNRALTTLEETAFAQATERVVRKVDAMKIRYRQLDAQDANPFNIRRVSFSAYLPQAGGSPALRSVPGIELYLTTSQLRQGLTAQLGGMNISMAERTNFIRGTNWLMECYPAYSSAPRDTQSEETRHRVWIGTTDPSFRLTIQGQGGGTRDVTTRTSDPLPAGFTRDRQELNTDGVAGLAGQVRDAAGRFAAPPPRPQPAPEAPPENLRERIDQAADAVVAALRTEGRQGPTVIAQLAVLNERMNRLPNNERIGVRIALMGRGLPQGLESNTATRYQFNVDWNQNTPVSLDPMPAAVPPPPPPPDRPEVQRENPVELFERDVREVMFALESEGYTTMMAQTTVDMKMEALNTRLRNISDSTPVERDRCIAIIRGWQSMEVNGTDVRKQFEFVENRDPEITLVDVPVAADEERPPEAAPEAARRSVEFDSTSVQVNQPITAIVTPPNEILHVFFLKPGGERVDVAVPPNGDVTNDTYDVERQGTRVILVPRTPGEMFYSFSRVPAADDFRSETVTVNAAPEAERSLEQLIRDAIRAIRLLIETLGSDTTTQGSIDAIFREARTAMENMGIEAGDALGTAMERIRQEVFGDSLQIDGPPISEVVITRPDGTRVRVYVENGEVHMETLREEEREPTLTFGDATGLNEPVTGRMQPPGGQMDIVFTPYGTGVTQSVTLGAGETTTFTDYLFDITRDTTTGEVTFTPRRPGRFALSMPEGPTHDLIVESADMINERLFEYMRAAMRDVRELVDDPDSSVASFQNAVDNINRAYEQLPDAEARAQARALLEHGDENSFGASYPVDNGIAPHVCISYVNPPDPDNARIVQLDNLGEQNERWENDIREARDRFMALPSDSGLGQYEDEIDIINNAYRQLSSDNVRSRVRTSLEGDFTFVGKVLDRLDPPQRVDIVEPASEATVLQLTEVDPSEIDSLAAYPSEIFAGEPAEIRLRNASDDVTFTLDGSIGVRFTSDQTTATFLGGRLVVRRDATDRTLLRVVARDPGTVSMQVGSNREVTMVVRDASERNETLFNEIRAAIGDIDALRTDPDATGASFQNAVDNINRAYGALPDAAARNEAYDIIQAGGIMEQIESGMAHVRITAVYPPEDARVISMEDLGEANERHMADMEAANREIERLADDESSTYVDFEAQVQAINTSFGELSSANARSRAVTRMRDEYPAGYTIPGKARISVVDDSDTQVLRIANLADGGPEARGLERGGQRRDEFLRQETHEDLDALVTTLNTQFADGIIPVDEQPSFTIGLQLDGTIYELEGTSFRLERAADGTFSLVEMPEDNDALLTLAENMGEAARVRMEGETTRDGLQAALEYNDENEYCHLNEAQQVAYLRGLGHDRPFRTANGRHYEVGESRGYLILSPTLTEQERTDLVADGARYNTELGNTADLAAFNRVLERMQEACRGMSQLQIAAFSNGLALDTVYTNLGGDHRRVRLSYLAVIGSDDISSLDIISEVVDAQVAGDMELGRNARLDLENCTSAAALRAELPFIEAELNGLPLVGRQQNYLVGLNADNAEYRVDNRTYCVQALSFLPRDVGGRRYELHLSQSLSPSEQLSLQARGSEARRGLAAATTAETYDPLHADINRQLGEMTETEARIFADSMRLSSLRSTVDGRTYRFNLMSQSRTNPDGSPSTTFVLVAEEIPTADPDAVPETQGRRLARNSKAELRRATTIEAFNDELRDMTADYNRLSPAERRAYLAELEMQSSIYTIGTGPNLARYRVGIRNGVDTSGIRVREFVARRLPRTSLRDELPPGFPF